MKASDVRVLLLNPVPSLIKYGIKWGFDKCGCYTYLMEGDDQVYLLRQEQDRSLALRRIEKAIITHDINLLFCEGYANMPIAEISEICKRHNVKFHWWAIEDPVTPNIGENVVKQKLVDYIWTTTVEFINKYKTLGIPSDLLMFACNPDFHKPVIGEDRFKHDISVIGTNYSNRFDKTKEFIFPLIQRDYDIMIYGQWWMKKEQKVNLIEFKDKGIYWQEDGYIQLPYEWLPIVINSSKIMFGLNCSDKSTTQTSCRPYETLASSGESVYVAYYTPAQNYLFKDYIVQAHTGREMLDKVDDVLTWSDAKRRAMAQEARNYVVSNHTYESRAKQIIKVILEGD